MHEADLIRRLAALFPRSPRQCNALFACDAEIVDLGNGQRWGITTDTFAPDEDCFGSSDPERIGRNVAVATLSDLFAAGCRPQFYLHALDLPPDGEAFSRQLCTGVATILDACDAFMLGGDLGGAAAWRCTATALGPLARREPLTRILPFGQLQALYVTGTIGDANAAALQQQGPPEFELRQTAATAIRTAATACIDTSDGLLAALWQLHTLNPGFRFELNPDCIPYAAAALAAATRFQVPPVAFLAGGAGEYELLFAAPADAAVPDATRIGTIAPAPAGYVSFGAHRFTAPPPDPRAFPDRHTYLSAIIAWCPPC